MTKKVLCFIASFCFIISLFLEVIDINCFNYNFYVAEYAKLHVAEEIGTSSEELMEATRVLLDYTSGKREDMVVYANIKGENREVYNDREKAHMVDVSALYLNAMAVKRICAAAGVICLFYMMFRRDGFLFTLSQSFNAASLVFLAVIGGLALYAASDFNSFWINFHHVFFTKNDFWLLNPKTDILINMVPEQFFFDLVFRIVIMFFSALSRAEALLFVLCI